jgi:hypothetical protein
MEEISRSVRQAKQAKFLDADCTCPYSPYGDVAGPYMTVRWMMWQHFYWLVVGEYGVDTCHWWHNNMRTRGPIHGRHVSLIGWFMIVM